MLETCTQSSIARTALHFKHGVRIVSHLVRSFQELPAWVLSYFFRVCSKDFVIIFACLYQKAAASKNKQT